MQPCRCLLERNCLQCSVGLTVKNVYLGLQHNLLYEIFCVLQIAPAESPDASERMVIITGPPEAQFKVSIYQTSDTICKVNPQLHRT